MHTCMYTTPEVSPRRNIVAVPPFRSVICHRMVLSPRRSPARASALSSQPSPPSCSTPTPCLGVMVRRLGRPGVRRLELRGALAAAPGSARGVGLIGASSRHRRGIVAAMEKTLKPAVRGRRRCRGARGLAPALPSLPSTHAGPDGEATPSPKSRTGAAKPAGGVLPLWGVCCGGGGDGE